ncbi:ribosome biogenesis factor YjgA [Methylobacillus glycogenes]|uniref:ribosome biogenesis factor YjgA n=1 Tax=Methylobacillus glycogenes TaxID=406 RepID=UPI00046ECC95|nr:ribosome biogenesis factor YjgA [Methylobacillus glycogenes]
MKPNKSENTEANLEQVVSKTKRKAEADAVQDIGVTLVGLPKDKLNKLNLPEALLDAVLEAKRITANGAIRRQMQYLGRLMRDIDTAPIVDQLQRWEGKHTEENARFHRLERWRDRLIEDDAAIAEFITAHPQTDAQQIRNLIRNARREQAASKPPKSSRELFKLLRSITENNQSETERLDD